MRLVMVFHFALVELPIKTERTEAEGVKRTTRHGPDIRCSKGASSGGCEIDRHPSDDSMARPAA